MFDLNFLEIEGPKRFDGAIKTSDVKVKETRCEGQKELFFFHYQESGQGRK